MNKYFSALLLLLAATATHAADSLDTNTKILKLDSLIVDETPTATW